MPNCFQLTKIGEREVTPLNTIDRELCALLGVDEHPKCYVNGWYDTIGYLIASGRKLGSPELRAKVTEWVSDTDDEYAANMLKCLDYLEANYTDSAWVEIGKRRD